MKGPVLFNDDTQAKKASSWKVCIKRLSRFCRKMKSESVLISGCLGECRQGAGSRHSTWDCVCAYLHTRLLAYRYSRVHTYTPVCVHVCLHIRLLACIPTYTSTCVHVYTFVCVHAGACMPTHPSACMQVFVCACLYTGVFEFRCPRVHTPMLACLGTLVFASIYFYLNTLIF